MKALFPFQTKGAHWLASRKQSFLADDMGLGKTVQAVRACDIVKARRVLVICPAVVVVNWEREFQAFSKTGIIPTSVSYDKLVRNLKKFTSQKWDVVVFDEAHFLKTPGSKRTQACLGKQGLIHQATRTFFLSGTPMPNHPAELWPWLFTVGAVKLGYDAFIDRFCHSYLFGSGYTSRKQVTGAKVHRIPELRELMKPHILRRKKEDVMKELPPITYTKIVIEPGDVVLDEDPWFVEYSAIVDRTSDLYARLERERGFVRDVLAHANVGRKVTRHMYMALEAIAQSVSTLRRYTGIQKVAPLGELITEELERNAYDKIVIFAVHQSVIEGLRFKLRPFYPLTMYGKTPAHKRQRQIDMFQNNKKNRVFIANIGACGTGVTLTASNQVIFAEQDWVPGNNAQAAMRCHRIGQTRPVFIRTAVLTDSLDSKISDALSRKTRDQIAIIDEQNKFLQECESGGTQNEQKLLLPKDLLD